ncbi:hypothetical protein I5H33_gp030 [Mycobacterium phage Emma]|uniref:Uncharacterized protein n=1 Tax=Mycobacterium phage Emma TaxID=2027893 RepID=A0A249XMD2_9CAUD|nr:hypothetical protein I5H33_gp030 [Mycobacterium phage Emma]ASZ72912.1 hypothetical protein SEA_EMMA_30 [Mycobacterium phage Emma]
MISKRVAGAIGTGLLGGVALTGLISWMFATGHPAIDFFIERDTLFYI